MIQFMIEKVIIKNFRTIDNLEINFNNINSIVGPNNVGKTTILQAMDNVLGESQILSKFDINDFHSSDNDTITIEISLAKSILCKDLTSTKDYEKYHIEIKKFVFEINKDGQELDYTFFAYSEDDQEFYGTNKIRKKTNFIYIPSNRDLKQQMYIGRSYIWGKILTKLNNSTEIDEKTIDDFTKSMIASDKILESNTQYKKLKEKLLENIKENTKGLNDQIQISFKIFEPSEFFKNLNIYGDIKDDPKLSINKLGYGTQNLIAITLFQTYAEIFQNKFTIAIEEPESFLDPHTQRILFDNLKKLSNEHIQIIYTTHSTHFIEPEMGSKIIMLRRIDNTTRIVSIPNRESLDELCHSEIHKIYTHFNPERNELFFAKKILFVEGDSDKILFETLCKKHWGINLNENGISIIECGGKGGVSYFVGVCRLIGLDKYYAVWDKDKDLDEMKYLDYTFSIKKGFIMEPKLEDMLGIKKSKEKKVEYAFKWASSDSAKQKLSILDPVKLFLNNAED